MKLYDILDLLRLNKLSRHTGYMLVFLPCVFGVGLYGDWKSSWREVVLFFLGAVIMRGAGCIINDIFDRNIDKNVERTKNRPIADGRIKIGRALIIFMVLSLCGLVVLAQFSWNAILVGFVSMFLLLTYPLVKRLTFWPQAYLGLTFNIGVFIAVMNSRDQITYASILLYVGCIFWTLYYDTLYAFADIKDDKKIGVKSLARFLESRNYRLWLGFFAIIADIIISCSFIITGHSIILVLAGFVCAAVFVFFQINALNIRDSAGCLQKFTYNTYLGFIWAIVSLL